jgi:Ca-activated chloride channel homolog
MRALVIGICILIVPLMLAQNAKKLLREGNQAYFAKKDYKAAEQLYKKALAADNKYGKASYNLGAAYFKQGKFDESAAQFEGIKSYSKNSDTIAYGLHNQGTAYLKAKKYDEAVKALKYALKQNPKDDDTRYNLAYAMYQKKKEDQKKKDKKQNQNQNQNQQQQQKQQQEQKKEQQQISQKEAERMLNALKQEEQKLQKNKRKKEEKSNENFSGKDW